MHAGPAVRNVLAEVAPPHESVPSYVNPLTPRLKTVYTVNQDVGTMVVMVEANAANV